MEDGGLNPPHFYITLAEINAALVAAGRPAQAQSQPSANQLPAPTSSLPSTAPQPEVSGTNNSSAPTNATGTPFVVELQFF
jgi:hypothetical protein